MTLLPCPVCNFLLSEPPEDFTFCPSCGTHFGYHDVGRTYDQIRERWFANGMKWWSPVRPKPKDWNAITQLSAGPLGTITQSLALAELQPNAIAPDFDCFRRHKAAVRGVRFINESVPPAKSHRPVMSAKAQRVASVKPSVCAIKKVMAIAVDECLKQVYFGGEQ